MKTETASLAETRKQLVNAYQPETRKEKEVLSQVAAHVGTWPECASCRKCTPGCQLIQDDYEGLLQLAVAEK